jgi:hypothetical protein
MAADFHRIDKHFRVVIEFVTFYLDGESARHFVVFLFKSSGCVKRNRYAIQTRCSTINSLLIFAVLGACAPAEAPVVATPAPTAVPLAPIVVAFGNTRTDADDDADALSFAGANRRALRAWQVTQNRRAFLATHPRQMETSRLLWHI